MKAVVEQVLKSVVLSTEDTYEALVSRIHHLSLKDRKAVLKQLERPFNELCRDYIIPHLFPLGMNEKNLSSFIPNFNKKIDSVLNQDSSKESIYDLTQIWLIRKEMEIEQILMVRGFERKVFDTVKQYKGIYLSFNFEQAVQFFNFLRTNNFIPFETEAIIFFKAISGVTFENPAEIKWNKGITLFNYLFHFLHIYGFCSLKDDEIWSTNNNNKVFVDGLDNNSPFKNMKNRNQEFEKKIALYEKNNTLSLIQNDKNMEHYEEIKMLDNFIKDLKNLNDK